MFRAVLPLLSRIETKTFLKQPQHTTYRNYYFILKGHETIFRSSALFNAKKFCETKSIEEIDIQVLTNGDPTLEKKFKILQLELEVLRQEGRNVPSDKYLKTHHWAELMKFPTRTARLRYYIFLFKTEMRKENIKLKKQEKNKKWEDWKEEQKQKPKEEDDGHIKYGLGHNTIFLRIYDTTMNKFYNHRLIEAMQFSQKLVLDCGYDEHMVSRESINCAKQLMLVFAENRAHSEPFDLHLCNADPKTNLIQALLRHIPNLYEPWFPLNVHEQSYLDIFPKEQLVYLTPHCRTELTEFDHDAIYIVGAMVDKINNDPLSLGKAKQEGLRMAKLPLDRYLQWGSGSGKSLTLNQCISILLDVRKTNDWTYALRHVPRRKVISEPQLVEKRVYRNKSSNLDNLSYSNKSKNDTFSKRNSRISTSNENSSTKKEKDDKLFDKNFIRDIMKQ